MTRLSVVAAGATAAFAGWTLAGTVGARRWSARSAAMSAKLEANRTPPVPRRHDAADLDGLPAPVQRYLRSALTDGQPTVASARVYQTGMFNMSPTKERWKPFSAAQHVSTRPAGFVWDARIMLMPGVPVRVIDSYFAGKGTLRASILGLVRMAELEGTGEIARGELMRWFSEAVWYPTALLPGQGVVWDAVDDGSAKASVTDGPIALTLLFRFGPDGMVGSVHADARARTVGAAAMMTPWECTLSDYRRQDGMLVPFCGTAAYVIDGCPQPYFRAMLDSVVYTFAA